LGGEYGNDLPFFQSKVAAFPGSLYLVYRLAYNDDIVGPPARREEGAYLNRYVTDEQRSRRPIFSATLWAAAGSAAIMDKSRRHFAATN